MQSFDGESDGIMDLESYGEQNALLRSFIYKAQIAQQKVSKLQEPRKRQRQQFAEYAEESQSEKRELVRQAELLKSYYEAKIYQITLNFEQVIKQKQQKIRNFEVILNDYAIIIEKTSTRSNNQESGSSDKKSGSCRNSEFYQQKIQKSIQDNSNAKINQIQKLKLKVQQLENNEIQFYKEIESLRIQRNQIAFENNNLIQQILVLKEQLGFLTKQPKEPRNIEREKQQAKNIKSRISDFIISEASSRLHTFQADNSTRDLQFNQKIAELEERLKLQEQRNLELNKKYAQLEIFDRERYNSIKLSYQMSQNAYSQLYQQFCVASEKHKGQHQQNIKKIEQLSEKVRIYQLSQQQEQKQKQLLQIECQNLIVLANINRLL